MMAKITWNHFLYLPNFLSLTSGLKIIVKSFFIFLCKLFSATVCTYLTRVFFCFFLFRIFQFALVDRRSCREGNFTFPILFRTFSCGLVSRDPQYIKLTRPWLLTYNRLGFSFLLLALLAGGSLVVCVVLRESK